MMHLGALLRPGHRPGEVLLEEGDRRLVPLTRYVLAGEVDERVRVDRAPGFPCLLKLAFEQPQVPAGVVTAGRAHVNDTRRVGRDAPEPHGSSVVVPEHLVDDAAPAEPSPADDALAPE